MVSHRHIHDCLVKLQHLTQVGTVVKPIGFDGQVLISVKHKRFLRFLQSLEVGDFVFLDQNPQKPVPFQIQELDLKSNPHGFSLFLLLSGIADKQAARALANAPVFAYVPDGFWDDAPPIEDLSDLQDFELIDRGVAIGKIVHIESLPGQFLATVAKNEQASFDFPLHEDFIENIDTKAQKLYTQLPKGIFDL